MWTRCVRQLDRSATSSRTCRPPLHSIASLRNAQPMLEYRLVHTQVPIVRVQQVSRLRLVAAIPESYVASVTTGQPVPFTAAAFGDEMLAGTVARVARALDAKTRTMAVATGPSVPSSFAFAMAPPNG